MRPVIEPGRACVREKGGGWNISILLDSLPCSFPAPTMSTERAAKQYVEQFYPNCGNYMSMADMIAEIAYRRSQRAIESEESNE